MTFCRTSHALFFFIFISLFLLPQLAFEAVKGWNMCRKNIHHSFAFAYFFCALKNPFLPSLNSTLSPHSKIISFLFKFLLGNWTFSMIYSTFFLYFSIHIQTTSRERGEKGRRFDFHLNFFPSQSRLAARLRFLSYFYFITEKHTQKGEEEERKSVQKKWNCMLLVLASVTGDGYCIIAV